MSACIVAMWGTNLRTIRLLVAAAASCGWRHGVDRCRRLATCTRASADAGDLCVVNLCMLSMFGCAGTCAELDHGFWWHVAKRESPTGLPLGARLLYWSLLCPAGKVGDRGGQRHDCLACGASSAVPRARNEHVGGCHRCLCAWVPLCC